MAKPAYVIDLEKFYGAPSQSGFGSAVFFEPVQMAGDVEKKALEMYKHFVGDLWQRYGEDAWMGPWKKVYSRTKGGKHDIVTELRSIQDPDVASSVSMLLDNNDNGEQALNALSAAFDAAATNDLQVFGAGDGAAMSGLLIAGQRANEAGATFLVFLMD